MQASAARPGDTRERAFARFIEEWGALPRAAIAEILAALYDVVAAPAT